MQANASVGPFEVATTEHLWIKMPDGVRLAARLWLPSGATRAPVPAIFEYIPYRKADMVRARDERNHPFFASHGYACLRIDMRGSGDSDGQMPDMYADAELADARHVIKWIASQPWCNGSVGMFGTSWGGTASLQANIDAVPALKAIIAVCATHDRYEDDIHHMGGCLLTDTFEWGATLPAILAAPPTPNVGEAWKDLWQARLQALPFPVEHWVREEARGAYWRHGSVIHQADRLSRPILAVGGWADRYSNSVMSLLAARPDLAWGVVGPWGHHYPDQGHPGPAIGFQQLALDWWDHWLKPSGKPPDWPRLRVWMREFEPPEDAIDLRRGHWIEAASAADETAPLLLHLADGALSPSDGGESPPQQVPNDLRIGLASGDTGYFGRYGGLPTDQSADDARSLTFETTPLDDDLVLFGPIAAQIAVKTSTQPSQLALRVNDVSPDGVSTRVVMTLRNLALNEALDEFDGEQTTEQRVNVAFPNMAYRFAKGHRLRLSISASYWPLIWPTAADEGVTLGSGTLSIPVVNGTPTRLSRALPPALTLPVDNTHSALSSPPLERFVSEAPEGHLRQGWEQPFTESFCSETQTAFGFRTRAEYQITLGDPLSAQCNLAHHARYTRPDGIADIRSDLSVTCTEQAWRLEGKLSAQWDGDVVHQKNWTKTIPRQFG